MTTKYNHFNRSERNELSILLKKGYSYREIGPTIHKNPSSISREVKDNSVNGKYDPEKAHHKAYVKRHYAKYQGMKIAENDWLEQYVKDKLSHYWTPEEITGRLELEHSYSVITFNSIYKWLYSARGQWHCQYLPSKRYQRKKRGTKRIDKTLIPNRTPIELRPNIINFRKRYGDFEADTLGVPRQSRGTLAGAVDRKSRYFSVKKIKRIGQAIDAFKDMESRLSIYSFTLDNGVENVRHRQLAATTYFCNPYSSWEKGAIENTFQRLRRFIPKDSLIQKYSDEEIARICDIMNNTPRKCLNWKTPNEVLKEHSEQPTSTYQLIKKNINKLLRLRV